MRLKKLIKMTFEKGNVCVTGLRGCGKDMLFANCIARRKQHYISNVDYKCKNALCIPLVLPMLDIKNTYKNFLSGEIIPYEYPYPEGGDVYISDAGVYFPSQYHNELAKNLSQFVSYPALSRHLSNANFHCNVQNLNRLFLLLREQSDIYIQCNSCTVLDNTFLAKIPIIKRLIKGLVFQTVTIYDKYESCVSRVQPFKPCPKPLLASKELRAQLMRSDIEAKRRYSENYGSVKRKLLIYRNKSQYDTRLFKSLLRGCKDINEEIV